MNGADRFSYTDNGACIIVHDDKTGINRASCYSVEDAVAICTALNKVEAGQPTHNRAMDAIARVTEVLDNPSTTSETKVSLINIIIKQIKNTRHGI